MIEVVCAVIENERGEVLAARRPAHKALGGKWEFPGGKLHHGETPWQALQREIREELQVEIAIVAALTPVTHAYPGFQIRLIPFRARIISGDPVAVEHTELRWVKPGEPGTLDWAEADIPVLLQLEGASGDAF